MKIDLEFTSGRKQSAFTSGRTVPVKARKSQIKCEATRGTNIARTEKSIIKQKSRVTPVQILT